MVLYEEKDSVTVSMTDKEIIEAVKCCSSISKSCIDCPLLSLKSATCILALNDNAYNLIMQQKRKIEELEKEQRNLICRLMDIEKGRKNENPD